MHETVIGLDLGDRLVTAARVQTHHDGKVMLLQAGVQECEAGTSEKQLAQAVRSLWKKCGFPSLTVSTCLRSQSVAIRHFKFPGISERDLPGALKLEAEEALQTPPDRLALDWHLTRNEPVPDGAGLTREIEGVLVAALRSDVDRHLGILRKAGLYPVVMDMGPMAISNLFVTLRGREAASKNVCLLNLGRRFADLAILYNGLSIYPRTVYSRSSDWSDALGYLADNVQDALKFYQFKLRRESVRGVLLCGQVPTGGDFLARLGEAVGVPVEVWNPVREMTQALRVGRALAGAEQERGPALAAAAGLALRGG